MSPAKLFTELSDTYINQPFFLLNSLWSCYNYSNKMQNVPKNSCENYLGYFMNKFGFFFSSSTFTNIYCICTLSIRTAWEQSQIKYGKWGVRQLVPFLLLINIILCFFKYHHLRNPMHDIVPKPTPNCFAVHLSQQVSHLLLQTEHLEATKAQLVLLHQSSLFVWCFFQIWKFLN